MGFPRSSIPLNAKIIASSDSKTIYQMPDGSRFLQNGITGELSDLTAFDTDILRTSTASIVDNSNMDWANKRIVDMAGKSLDDWWKTKSVSQSPKRQKPKTKPEEEYKYIPTTTFEAWASKWKPGDSLPLSPPGMSLNLCQHSGGGSPLESFRNPTVDEVLNRMWLPDERYVRVAEPRQGLSEKGILGAGLGMGRRNLLDFDLARRNLQTGFGIWRDGLNKLRCGPGSPAANRFTNIFGLGCDIPGGGDGPLDNIAAAIPNLNAPKPNAPGPKSPKTPKQAVETMREILGRTGNRVRPLRVSRTGEEVSGSMGADDGDARAVRILPRATMRQRMFDYAARLVRPVSRVTDRKKEWLKSNPDGRPFDASIALYHETLGRHGGNPNLMHAPVSILNTKTDVYGEVELFDPRTGTYRFMNQQDLIEGWDPDIAKWSTNNASDPKIAKQLREKLRNSMSLQSGDHPFSLREYDQIISNIGTILDGFSVAIERTAGENGSIPAMMLTGVSIGDVLGGGWSDTEMLRAQVRGMKPVERRGNAENMLNQLGIQTRWSQRDASPFLTADDLAAIWPAFQADARGRLGAGATDDEVDIGASKLWQDPDQRKKIMARADAPMAGQIVINPNALTDAALNRWRLTAGEHYLASGRPNNNSDLLHYTAAHEMEHLADFARKVQTLMGIDDTKWSDWVRGQRPINLDDAADGSIMRQAIDRLKTQWRSMAPATERISALLEFYMIFISTSGNSPRSAEQIMRDSGATKKQIAEMFERVNDAMERIGIIGEHDWWKKIYADAMPGDINSPNKSTGTQNASGHLVSEDDIGIMMDFLGSIYGQSNTTEMVAELGALLFQGGNGMKLIRDFVNGPENTDGISMAEFLDVIEAIFGKARMPSLDEGLSTGGLTYKSALPTTRQTKIQTAGGSTPYNYTNAKVLYFTKVTDIVSSKVLGRGLTGNRMRSGIVYDPNARDGDGDGIRQDRTRWERPVGPRAPELVHIGALNENRKNRRRRGASKIRGRRVNTTPSFASVASRRNYDSAPTGSMALGPGNPLARSTDNDWLVDLDAYKSLMLRIEDNIDQKFNGRPRTIGDVLDKLATAKDGLGKRNINLDLVPAYWLIPAMSAMKSALGGRYSGNDTVVSPTELGAYYSLMHHLDQYPEAFQDISLIFSPSSMPDAPSFDGPVGATSVRPTYETAAMSDGSNFRPEFHRMLPGLREGLPYPDMENSPVVSESGAGDLTKWESTIQPRLRRGVKTVIVQIPSTTSGHGKYPSFQNMKDGNSFEIQLDQIGDRNIGVFIDEMYRLLENNSEGGQLIDNVGSVVLTQLIKDAADKFDNAMRSAESNPSMRGQIVSAATARADADLDEIAQAASFLIATHEFGHVLDSVGNWRRSPLAANQHSSRGLNTVGEFRRTITELSAIEDGLDSPLAKPLYNSLASTFVFEHVNDALASHSAFKEMTGILQQMRQQLDEFGSVLSLFDSMATDARNNGADTSAMFENSGLASIMGQTPMDLLAIFNLSVSSQESALDQMRLMDRVMRSQYDVAAERLRELYEKVTALVPVYHWINKQSFDVNNIGRQMTDIRTTNPNAIAEFMQNFGNDVYGKSAWFDDDGQFNERKYIISALNKMADPDNYHRMLSRVNDGLIMQGNNGWKNLGDDDIEALVKLIPYLSTYAGPAFYPDQIANPENYPGSNSEAYAEMHLAQVLAATGTLDHFDEIERARIEKIYKRMIDWARNLIEDGMVDSGN